jgi:glucan phosphoethanolaminetransferase (alkaline phosphatase superfamily)
MNMISTSQPLLKGSLIAIPAWCFCVLLWSGMGHALVHADRWWSVAFLILLSLGLCVPSALTAEYIWRKRHLYSSIASRTAAFLLVVTSIVIFSFIGYAAESGFMGGWELLLWILVCMIQLLIYGTLVYVCDRESWNK